MVNAADSVAERFRALQAERPEAAQRHYMMSVRDFGHGRAEITTWLPHHNPMNGHLAQVVPTVAKAAPASPEERHADDIERACRRARQRVRWLCKAIRADHLLTLTYRDNVQDVKRLARDWQEFVRLIRKRHSTWVYVMVREYQERGALHVHCACVGRQDVNYLRQCWYAVVGVSQGQINVRGPSKRWGSKTAAWNPSKLSGYMCKYMVKDFARAEAEKKRYWASKGIEVPKAMYWLGATNFVDAIKETYTYVHALGGAHTKLWTSKDWRCIWVDASG